MSSDGECKNVYIIVMTWSENSQKLIRSLKKKAEHAVDDGYTASICICRQVSLKTRTFKFLRLQRHSTNVSTNLCNTPCNRGGVIE